MIARDGLAIVVSLAVVLWGPDIFGNISSLGMGKLLDTFFLLPRLWLISAARIIGSLWLVVMAAVSCGVDEIHARDKSAKNIANMLISLNTSKYYALIACQSKLAHLCGSTHCEETFRVTQLEMLLNKRFAEYLKRIRLIVEHSRCYNSKQTAINVCCSLSLTLYFSITERALLINHIDFPVCTKK